MDIDGYDGRFNPNDARQFAPKVADPRAAGLSGEAGDDQGTKETLVGVHVQSARPNRQLEALSSRPVNSIPELALLVEEQFAVMVDEVEQTHHGLMRMIARELETALSALQRSSLPEARDEGIREHMRVIQGQTRSMQHECLAKLEALKEIGATEFQGASEALSFAVRDIAMLARRAIVVSVSVNVILGCVLAATIVW